MVWRDCASRWLPGFLMEIETALVCAVTGVVTALTYVCSKLWDKCEHTERRADSCEADRDQLRSRIENLEAANGLAKGALTIYERCRLDACPFKSDLSNDDTVVIAKQLKQS